MAPLQNNTSPDKHFTHSFYVGLMRVEWKKQIRYQSENFELESMNN